MHHANKRDQIIDIIKQQKDIFHPSEIAGLTGASVPYVQNVILSLFATKQLTDVKDGRRTLFKLIDGQPIKDTQTNHQHAGGGRGATELFNEFTVRERFIYVDKFAQMVVEGDIPSMFFTGVSGIGKTFAIQKLLHKNGLTEQKDYIFVKGHSSPFGLYSILYWNKKSLIVFDDCDKAFDNEISASLLKAALDNYDKRVVSWHSRSIPSDSDMERSFEFEGKIIFISNKTIESVDEAVRTRTLCVNLAMTRPEITEYMKGLLDKIEPDKPLLLKQEVMKYLEEVQTVFVNYNLRTLIKAIRIRSRYEDETIWKNMIKITAYNE